MALSRLVLGVHYPSDVLAGVGASAPPSRGGRPARAETKIWRSDERGADRRSSRPAEEPGQPAIVKAIRPRQWVKNVLVLAAPLAALGGDVHYDYRDVLAARSRSRSWCSAWRRPAIYLINDARDVEADRAHPTKRFRPIAAGVVPEWLAYALAVVLGGGLAGASPGWLTPNLALVMAIYIAIQLAYCFGLKHQAVLDICIVSSGFLLRAIAGGVAADIPLSQWFLLVMAFGSLFMAAGKRYAELQLAERTGAKIRKSLESYTSTYLRFVWTLSATAVVLCYGLWAFERDSGCGVAGSRSR